MNSQEADVIAEDIEQSSNKRARRSVYTNNY